MIPGNLTPLPTARIAPLALALAAAAITAPTAAAQIITGPPLPNSIPATVGSWDGPYPWPIPTIHTALLPTGKVLTYAYKPNQNPGAKGVLYDPTTGTQQIFDFPTNTFCSGHSLLPDGRLLIAGGTLQHAGENGVGIDDTYIWNSWGTGWTLDQDMQLGRYYPTLLTLTNGKTLVLAGRAADGTSNALAEVFQAGSGWSVINGANHAMEMYPRVHLLPDGRVLHAGPEKTTEIFDTTVPSWTTIGQYAFGDRFEGCTVQIPGSTTRFMGLGGFSSTTGSIATETTEIIDMSAASPAWTSGPSMNFPRLRHNTVILPDGTVFVCGGQTIKDLPNTAVMPCEIYRPNLNDWRVVAPLNAARMYHSSTVLLPDGRVMIGGGDQELTVEYYSPPYMFRPRPTIDNAPGTLQYGQQFAIDYSLPTAGDAVKSVALLRPTATTHSVQMDQRYVALNFIVHPSQGVLARAPTGPSLAPPGYYLLVITNSRNTPSVMRFVQLQ